MRIFTMKDNGLRPKISSSEKIWLKEIYNEFLNNKVPTIRSIKVKLLHKLPSNFDPKLINKNFLRDGNRITLPGIWIIDRNSDFLKKCEKFILYVKNYIKKYPQVSIINSSQITAETDINRKALYNILEILRDTGRFFKAFQSNTENEVVSLDVGEDSVFEEYLNFKSIENHIIKILNKTNDNIVLSTQLTNTEILSYPLIISESFNKFNKDNPFFERNAFIMMQFGRTKLHKLIVDSVRKTLKKYDIQGFRADDKQYHDDLFYNVLTYIYGCRFGIAIFERLEDDLHNPNVALEVGYMIALKKPVCLLRDNTLRTLQTDLVGKLYKSFDPQNPGKTIPGQLENWLTDKDIILL